MDDKLYYIKRDARTKDGKDAPWLMNYKDSGLTEVTADGTRQPVYTCLWGCRMRDAKSFKDEGLARSMAKRIGGCVVISVKKEGQ
ncbi:MAG: hypothetical protein IJ893_02875 [Bacteroidales bacterium]|nr:hypothetical protein [Bacteroidales bacterium]